MEITTLPKGGIKIKGKQTTLVAGTIELAGSVNAILLYSYDETTKTVVDDTLIVDGPGDYEVNSVKISTYRNGIDLAHSFSIDGLDVVVGKISSLEKMQSKVGEHQIAVIMGDTPADASFAANLATNCLVFYGEHAKAAAEKVTKTTLQELTKFTVTMDKLPVEVETILLQ